MRTFLGFFAAVLLSTAAYASSIRFEPPAATSATPVVAHITITGWSCPLGDTRVTRTGRLISITAVTTSCPAAPPPAGGYTSELTADLGVLPAGVYDVVVGPEQLLIALAEATLVVREQTPAFVVRPNTVSVNTAQRVVIAGSDFITCPAGPSPVICPHPTVRFGSVDANVVSASATEIVVDVPTTLTPGTYDVTVQRTNGATALTAIAAFNVTSNAVTPDPAFYEPVLFPVFSGGPGAFGAQWRTEASLHNGSDLVYSAPGGSIFNVICMPICDIRPQPGAGTTIARADNGGSPAGVLEYVPRQIAPQQDFGLLVRDVSRAAQDLGTEIPVVRESELHARSFSLLNVPADSRYRITLRAYDVAGPRALILRIYQLDGTKLIDQPLQLTAEPSLRGGGYGAIGDLLATYPALVGRGPLRIELQSAQTAGGAATFWGFVSITNNDTQHVTVISPQ